MSIEQAAVRRESTESHETKPQGSRFEVLTNYEYIDVLERMVPKAERRFYVQTMAFEPGKTFDRMKNLLITAKKQGLKEVRFFVDHYSKMVLGETIYYMPSRSGEKQRVKKEKEESLSNLRNNEVKVRVTNPPKGIKEHVNPSVGRNHIKAGVLDGTAWIGDLNFVDADKPGLMVMMTDPNLVEGVAKMMLEAGEEKTEDQMIPSSDGQTSLLIDAGVRGQSLILDKAVEMITDKETDEIILVNQFTPDGKIVPALEDAVARKVPVSTIVPNPEVLIYKGPKMFDLKNRIFLKLRGFTRRKKIPRVELDEWIHAKILWSPTRVLVGTHCLSGKGVAWGNGEAMLDSRDPELIKQVKDYIDKLLGESENE